LHGGNDGEHATFAQREPARWRERLVDAAATLPIGKLEDGLRTVVEDAVRESFEAFRVAESARVERARSLPRCRRAARGDEGGRRDQRRVSRGEIRVAGRD
jgi:hypothetical protein